MHIKNTTTQYGLVARALHWSSVTLLLTLVVLSSQFEGLPASGEKSRLIALHASIGLLFFLIMLARLTWRQVNPNPIHSYSLKNWQKLTAISLHKCIYIVLISQSAVGLASVVTSEKPIRLFNLFQLMPHMKEYVLLHHVFLNIHHFISIMIYPLLAVHISAAIYHQIFGLIDDE